VKPGRKKSTGRPWAALAPVLGGHLRRVREDRNTTREKLGSDAGVAASTIAKLESGQVNEPGLFTVWAICTALDYDIRDLFEVIRAPQPTSNDGSPSPPGSGAQ
jgi:transcriptional regulator with XRE-family HTH domain